MNLRHTCIIYPDVHANFVLKFGLIHLLYKFHRLTSEDCHKHLKEFHIVCSIIKPHEIFKKTYKV